MRVIINNMSKHVGDRLREAYGMQPQLNAIMQLIKEHAHRNMIEFNTRDDEVYIIVPNHGVFPVKNGTVTTFIHKSRLGNTGMAQRAYARYITNADKKAA